MGKKQKVNFAVLSLEIGAVNAEGKIHVLPAGRFRGNDGRPYECESWYLDAQLAQRLIEKLAGAKKDKMIDYEHQTLYTRENGKPNPAAGWLTDYEWVEGKGLFASPNWTKVARDQIDNDEYRYLSPVFLYDLSGNVIELVNAALTNTPALDELDPVALAALSQNFQFQQEQEPMNEALKALCKLLGLPEAATDAEQVAALNQLADKVSGGTGGVAACSKTLIQYLDDEAVRVAALSAQTVDPTRFVSISDAQALQTQVAALSSRLAGYDKKEHDQLVQAALSDGRLFPSQKTWAEGQSTEVLTAFLSATPAMPSFKGNQPVVIDAASGKSLSEAEVAVCSQMGMSHEDFIKAREAESN